MNRRDLITGAAALAASAVVPVGLVAAKAAPSPTSLEFVRVVTSLPAETKIVAAAQIRLMAASCATNASASLLLRLADIVERMGREEGATGAWRGMTDMTTGVAAVFRVSA